MHKRLKGPLRKYKDYSTDSRCYRTMLHTFRDFPFETPRGQNGNEKKTTCGEDSTKIHPQNRQLTQLQSSSAKTVQSSLRWRYIVEWAIFSESVWDVKWNSPHEKCSSTSTVIFTFCWLALGWKIPLTLAPPWRHNLNEKTMPSSIIIIIYFLAFRPSGCVSHALLPQPLDLRTWYIAYISVCKPTPWAVAGPHEQLVSSIFLRQFLTETPKCKAWL